MTTPTGRREGLTGEVVTFVDRLSWDALGDGPTRAAKSLLMDAIAAAIAGVDQPGMPEVKAVGLLQSGAEEATLIGDGRRISRAAAAFINGSLIHALDYDDKNYEAGMHISASVVPMSLAESEFRQRSGRDVIVALVAGVEVATRLGEAAMASRMPPGFLPSSIIGGFGATAAGAKLAGLRGGRVRDAFGLSLAQASGTRQALLDKTLAKRIQPAFAARNAATAVQLAEHGISGPSRVFEGDGGLFPLFVGSPAPGWTELEHPTGTWAIERYWLKQFPSCGGAHRATLAALRLAHRGDLSPEDIVKVEIEVPQLGMWHLADPYEPGRTPQVSAQFSLRYGVAVALLRGAAGLAEFSEEETLRSPDIAALADRAVVTPIAGTAGRRSDEVAVTVRVWSGETVLEETVLELPGRPSRPVDLQPAEAKLRDSLEFAGVPERTDRMIAAITDFEHAGPEELLSSLTGIGSHVG